MGTAVMDKAIKTLRQLLHLGVLWVATCAGLVGIIAYTKTGIETLMAEQMTEPTATRTRHAVAASGSAPPPAVTVLVKPTTAAPSAPSQAEPSRATPAQPAAQGRQAPAATTSKPDTAAEPRLVDPPQRFRRAL